MIPHDPRRRHMIRAEAWEQVAVNLRWLCPDFPIAAEVAQRLADHHASALPLGWESTPIMGGEE